MNFPFTLAIAIFALIALGVVCLLLASREQSDPLFLATDHCNRVTSGNNTYTYHTERCDGTCFGRKHCDEDYNQQ